METTRIETTESDAPKVVDAEKAEIIAEPAPAIVSKIRLRTSHPKVLKTMIDAISGVIDETYLEPEELKVMDESHICLFALHHKALWDLNYVWPEEAPTKLGIDLEDLAKILKALLKAKPAYLEIGEDETEEGLLTVSTDKSRLRLRFIEIDEDKIPPTAELDVLYDAHGDCSPQVLLDGIAQCEIYQTTTKISIDPHAEVIIMSAEGEVGDARFVNPIEDVSGKQSGSGVFSLNFLKNILKVASIAPKVHISLASNAPMLLRFTLGVTLQRELQVPDGRGGRKKVKEPYFAQLGTATYFLAPRVEEEESYESD